MCRKISAHYIFPANRPPLKRGIVVIDPNGTITDIIDTNGQLQESERLEFLDGIITPGFINALTPAEIFFLKTFHLPTLELNEQITAVCNEFKTGVSENVSVVLSPSTSQYFVKHFSDTNRKHVVNPLISLGTTLQGSDLQRFLFEEMNTLQNKLTDISLQELIAVGTINGAIALGCDQVFGSIEVGKSPGLNLITNINFNKMQLSSQSDIKVIR
jgi:cytosine/adenosine deaminase-related metal-dependent hydrolase